jgi:hypothetical protein
MLRLEIYTKLLLSLKKVSFNTILVLIYENEDHCQVDIDLHQSCSLSV